MGTHLDSVVIDTVDPPRLAGWWSRALGWSVTDGGPDESVVGPPAGEPGLPLVFGAGSDPKLVKNRVHLDLASRSVQEQWAIVTRLEELGARPADIGQGDVPWTVLVDLDGNEFCVLEPRGRYRRSGAVAAVVVDAVEPAELARFWVAASGWRLVDSGRESAALRPPAEAGAGTAGRAVGPYLEFVRTGEPHRVKNRWHLDVAPGPADDQAAEVARLTGLGARPVRIGQERAAPGEITWVVLADPEGNEFCVLTPRSVAWP